MTTNPNNEQTKQHSQHLILIALADGKWHRNKELLELTKLTPRSLSNNLREMDRQHKWIERLEDTETTAHTLQPHPILYKAKDTTLRYAKLLKATAEYANSIETMLDETKDPFPIFDDILTISKQYFINILAGIQYNKNKATPKQIEYITSLLLYSTFKTLIPTLIQAVTNNIQSGTQYDSITIKYNQLLESNPNLHIINGNFH